MALVVAGRVKETTTTTGTGTYSLGGASTGFRSFVSGVGDGNTCHYCCTDGTNYEIGIGTVTDAATDTLSRDTILYSSNGNAKVSWVAGTRDIFVTLDGGASTMRSALGLDPGPGLEISGSTIRQTTSAVTLSAATTLVNGDRGKLFDCSGQFTINFTSANALDVGWASEFKNSGSSAITFSAISLIDGVSTLTLAAGANAEILNIGSTFRRVGMMLPATQAQMEAYSSTGVAVTPAVVQYHPGVAKAWADIQGVAVPASIITSYNVNSVTDNGTGDYTLNFSTAFSNANLYITIGLADISGGSTLSTSFLNVHTQATNSLRILTNNNAGTIVDASVINVCCLGDQ